MPVGPEAVSRFLEAWHSDKQLNLTELRVLVMGLCGSLHPRYQVGDAVLYQECVPSGVRATTGAQSALNIQWCDRSLTHRLASRLAPLHRSSSALVRAVTTHRVIHSAQEKQRLAQTHNAEVVDMEGFGVLKTLGKAGVAVAMLRVVSDNCEHDLPDLSAAFSPDGNLLPHQMAISMLRQPIAATRLIRGSLQGLAVLQNLTTTLFSEPQDLAVPQFSHQE